jgi:hypothetical protein
MKHQFNPSEVPASFAEAFASGKPIVLVCRLSRNGAHEDGANLSPEAVKFLADHGIDIRASIPSKTELVSQLNKAVEVKVGQTDGRTSTIKVLRLDLRVTRSVIFVISGAAGGRACDDGVQSYVDYLAEVVKESEAIALFVPRIDRMARQASGFGPVLQALEQHGGFFGDPVSGFSRAGSVESFLASIGAQSDGANAIRQSEWIVRGIREAKERRAPALTAE